MFYLPFALCPLPFAHGGTIFKQDISVKLMSMPSSVISRFSYNSAKQVLRVVFVSGLVYDYKNVPEQVYNDMKMSFSKGTYLNKYIKGNYPFEKVPNLKNH